MYYFLGNPAQHNFFGEKSVRKKWEEAEKPFCTEIIERINERIFPFFLNEILELPG